MKVASILSIVFSIVFVQIQAAPLGSGSDPLNAVTGLAEPNDVFKALQAGGPLGGIAGDQKTASSGGASGGDPISGLTGNLL
ncbi:hypothetical protein BJ944DRAFT_273953 [Cunninghamella echinulata]|nr:hypothetical protein BJ944DRAFT_273953 [Cunninghamella echinulata]